MQKIGVFICWCGSNISSTVDVEKVKNELEKQNQVVFCTTFQYICSNSGQQLIIDTIKNLKLTGVLICSCSPRMHELTFQKTLQQAGLNPYMLEIANIREQCSWIHKDKEIATQKAILLAKTALAKLIYNVPLTPSKTLITKRALVIGGGIAGIQAALDIAQAGYKVDILEKNATIGGKMAQLDKTFPTLDCSACILTPKMVECSQNENIEIISYSELERVSGFVGNFEVTIKQKARYVDTIKCTGCGICQKNCPIKNCPNEFNLNMNTTTAIHIPFPQAIPYSAVIDENYCLKLKSNKCGLCQRNCPFNAIDFTQKEKIIHRNYGAIILATGYNTINLVNFNEYGYSTNRDVITSLELERIMSAGGPTKGELLRPSDSTHPKDITFIQCVGSRNLTDCGKTYCSKICCMYTAKQAIMIKEKYPNTNIRVFYIDVRTPGKRYDEFYRRAVEDYNVEYIKGMVGKVYSQNGKLLIQASDLIENEQLLIESDMVVLATAITPNETAKRIANLLSVSIDKDNFFNESHPKLKPVESATNGIFFAGVCSGPKDIPESVISASASACKVITLFSKNELQTNPCISYVDENLCTGCSQCKNVCPYSAIDYEDINLKINGELKTKRVSKINPTLCQGCGCCTPVCPSGAIDLKGFSNKQILMEIESLCKRN